MGLNGLCLMRILYFFDREQGFRGRDEINLLVHVCRSILHILYLSWFFFLSFFFLFFLSVYLFCCDSLLEVAIIVLLVIIVLIPVVHDKAPFYSAHRDWILPFSL